MAVVYDSSGNFTAQIISGASQEAKDLYRFMRVAQARAILVKYG